MVTFGVVPTGCFGIVGRRPPGLGDAYKRFPLIGVHSVKRLDGEALIGEPDPTSPGHAGRMGGKPTAIFARHRHTMNSGAEF